MSYLDDLRTCRYTSPSGATFDLNFDDVTREGSKKLAVNEPPQQDRAEVQDLGNAGIRLPMVVYISGPEYHTEADSFFKALSERYSQDAPATLSHPTWGDILVCPTAWTENRGFVENMGRATFSVEFIRIDRTAKFPATTTDAGAQLQADVDAAAESGRGAYAENGYPSTPADVANVGAKSANVFTAIGDGLRSMAATSDELGAQFESDLALALGTVDDLVAAPADLASSLVNLARLPAQAVMSISQKVEQYKSTFNTLAGILPASFAECELLMLSITGISSGACDAILTGNLENRSTAVDSSEWIGEILATVRALAEAAEASVSGWHPDAATMANLEAMLSTARGQLLEASFSLKTERRRVLAAAVDPNTLVRELLGTWSESALDQFIADNDLSDEEFFMIQAGREVVWYA